MKHEAVMSVDAITHLAFLKKRPPILFVEAEGTVPTLGWRDGHVVPRVYVKPPADGIQDLDFVAAAPTGVAGQALAKIKGVCMLDIDPSWMRGIRIHARDNSIEHCFFCETEALFEVDCETLEGELERFEPNHLEYSDQVEIEELVESVDAGEVASGRCHSFDLLSLSNYPEVKIEWENRCVVRWGGKCRVKTKVPITYRRTSHLKLAVKVCWPSQENIVGAVEDCAKQALAAGVLAGLLTGSLQAAAAALKTYLVSCLKSKGVQLAGDVSVKLDKVKRTSPWKRV